MIRYVREILISLAFTALAAVFTFGRTSSVRETVVVSVATAVLSALGCYWYNHHQEFRKHSEFLRSLNLELSPPKMCPVAVGFARNGIEKSIDATRKQVMAPLRDTGLQVTWPSYAQLLVSALAYNEKAFVAVCQLTPADFMSSEYQNYRSAQEDEFESWLPRLRRPWKRFRIMVVNKEDIQIEIAANREQVKQFFDWHKRVGISTYFVDEASFENTRQTAGNQIADTLNDFLYFSCDEYSWVVGTHAQPGAQGGITVKVLDSSQFAVGAYLSFAYKLRRQGRRARKIEQLVGW